MHKKNIIILPDIRSAYNVGSIFRTADAAGISAVYLTGYTPKPIDRFGRDRKDIAKAALGAEKTVPWHYFETYDAALAKVKDLNYTVVAIEQHKKAISYTKISKKQKIAFVFGNEVEGLSEKILKQADYIAQIPMHGKKESLNVGVAVGVVLFQAGDN